MPRKLTLRTETLRRLDTADTHGVAAAATFWTTLCWTRVCMTVTCANCLPESFACSIPSVDQVCLMR